MRRLIAGQAIDQREREMSREKGERALHKMQEKQMPVKFRKSLK
jgi:hypothetical protein